MSEEQLTRQAAENAGETAVNTAANMTGETAVNAAAEAVAENAANAMTEAATKTAQTTAGTAVHTTAEPAAEDTVNATVGTAAQTVTEAATEPITESAGETAAEPIAEPAAGPAPRPQDPQDPRLQPPGWQRHDGENVPPPPPRPRSRAWLGVGIGLCLGTLCVLSLFMLTQLTLRAGRGAQLPPPPATSGADSQSAAGDDPQQTADDHTRLQVHDLPEEQTGYTTEYIVEQVQDSVVGILIYDGTDISPAGGGTGIIMSEDGHIITNAHVVVDAANLTVVLHDDSRYPAIVLGYDEKTDLAVIKINATGLQPAEFGDSEQVVVGERAIAIGNPGGLSGSVSQGIISGKEREISIQLSDGSYAVISALQTDAAINPGNSGGPLLNAWGQVIGISSSKVVRNGYEGIGFAIPVSEARPIIDNLIEYGYVHDRAVLGITVKALDASNGPPKGLPSQGLYIASVLEYSDLNRYGIIAGDVILSVNGVEMLTNDDLSEQLKLFKPGDTISMEILRTYDNTTVTLDVLLLDSRAAEQYAAQNGG